MTSSTVDGSVVLGIDVDVSQAEKELSRLKDRITKLESDISEKAFNRSKISSALAKARKEIQKLEFEKPSALIDGKWADNSGYYEALSKARAEAEKLDAELKKIDLDIDKSNTALEWTKMRFGEVSEIAKTLTKEFDESTISGRLEKANYELAQISAQGKGLGDKEYDEAYRKLALLTNEAREYKKELAKTPEQAQREAELAQRRAEAEALAEERARQAEDKRQEQIAKEAAAAIAAQIAEQRLLDIKEKAVISDQHIVDLNEELAQLKARQAELQQAGVGLGYEEYDGILQRLREINVELKGYEDGQLQIEKDADKLVSKTDGASKAMSRLGGRIMELVKSAFIFNVISRGLSAVQQLTMRYIKTNDEARQAIAQMKGALLTLAQPLIEVVIPAFTLLVNILTRIITAVAQFVSMLFGKTLKQSSDGAQALHEEANAIDAVGEAADEAAGSLAGFDEINAINTESAKGGGGGAGDEDAPEFGDWEIDDGFLNGLKEIADLVGLIAAGLALWKISDMLPGVLGQMAATLGGILLTVGGLLLFWHGLTDAWENGVDWLNLIEMIGGLAAAAAGLYLVLGPIAAGIVLIVGGIAMLVTGFRDATENGWNLQNVLLSIAGILATGLGISLLAGSWIPLLVAGIASVLLALTVATGHGEELLDGIREVIEGFKDFFVGIFTGDIEKAIGGIGKIFEGLKKTVFSVIDGLQDTFLSFLNWLDEKTGGKFHGIIETAKKFVTTFFSSVKETLENLLDAVKQIFTGIIQFLTGIFTNDWDLAWEGVKNIFKGIWNGIVSLLEGAVNLIVKGINFLIGKVNGLIGDGLLSKGLEFIGVPNGKIPYIPEAKIPRLAQGAVIPPNREFMAVLGDQRRGMNIEAPADLIRQMVIEGIQAAGAAGGSGQPIQVNVMLDKRVLARAMVNEVNDMTRQAGKPVLLI